MSFPKQGFGLRGGVGKSGLQEDNADFKRSKSSFRKPSTVNMDIEYQDKLDIQDQSKLNKRESRELKVEDRIPHQPSTPNGIQKNN